MPPVITLTSDFGNQDVYAASMKGVILSINQHATVIDITHNIKSYNVEKAAFILSTVYHHFPSGTIHVVIIDPGVGSQRKAVILKTPSAIFIAPDNGVLSYIIDGLEPPSSQLQSATVAELNQKQVPANSKAISISNQKYWSHPVSTTFHGRDIFAPVAAHLSMGIPAEEFGEVLDSLYVFPVPHPYHDVEGNLNGIVLYIDHFGNLFTNISEHNLPQGKISITVGHHKISGLSTCYRQSEGLTAIISSNGYLEIALKEGNAAQLLCSRVGEHVKVSEHQ